MEISPQQWLIAFVVACAAHVLAGGLIWAAQNMAPAPTQSPRGVVVSLDSLMAGSQAQASSTPEPVAPIPATAATPVAATTPQVPTPAAPAPMPSTTIGPAPVVPQSTTPTPASATGVIPAANGVQVQVAQAVTIKVTDTLQAVQQAAPVQARPALPPAPADNGANGISQDPTMTYIARIRAWLGTHKYYPQVARSSGVQGTVRLYLIVDRNGSVLNISIAKSSGSPILDQAARDMVKRSEPLPPMSEDMLRTRLEIILPVQFTIGEIPE